MALVKTEEGKVKLCDGYDSGVATQDDTLKGGLIGSVLGILGGPIGVLLMGTYGALAGSIVDMGDAIGGGSLIEMVVDKLQDGTMALVILAEEKKEAAMDAMLSSGFKAEIRRYDAAAIAAEVEEAVLMEQEMARQARRKLRKEKEAAFMEKAKEGQARFEANLEEVREKIEEYGGDTMVD